MELRRHDMSIRGEMRLSRGMYVDDLTSELAFTRVAIETIVIHVPNYFALDGG